MPDSSEKLPRLPPRAPHGHKGSFGTVSIIGGCAAPERRMIGAPALAALAALRAGAGLVRLLMPEPILDSGIVLAPSAVGRALIIDDRHELIPFRMAEEIDAQTVGDSPCTCLAIGPGLGGGAGVRAATLRAVQQADVPVVVDADAINALAEIPELWRDFKAPAVLTPHPGEFRRLAGALKITADPAEAASRPQAAAGLAQKLGCVVVLKGAGTIVSDGQRTWRCERGHPCLATGGTGDVLTGAVAGIISQFSPAHGALRTPARPLDLYDAARLAVLAHAIAGENWAASHHAQAGLLAGELAELLPAALESLR